jgi:hypothetical protein
MNAQTDVMVGIFNVYLRAALLLAQFRQAFGFDSQVQVSWDVITPLPEFPVRPYREQLAHPLRIR